jgi:hypothetical protein
VIRCLVAGPDDPGSTGALPRFPFPTIFTQGRDCMYVCMYVHMHHKLKLSFELDFYELNLFLQI